MFLLFLLVNHSPVWVSKFVISAVAVPAKPAEALLLLVLVVVLLLLLVALLPLLVLSELVLGEADCTTLAIQIRHFAAGGGGGGCAAKRWSESQSHGGALLCSIHTTPLEGVIFSQFPFLLVNHSPVWVSKFAISAVAEPAKPAEALLLLVLVVVLVVVVVVLVLLLLVALLPVLVLSELALGETDCTTSPTRIRNFAGGGGAAASTSIIIAGAANIA
jgi:hypothetical protein